MKDYGSLHPRRQEKIPSGGIRHFKLPPDAVADTPHFLSVATLYHAGAGINRLPQKVILGL
jgi:hypothetical protein